MRDWAKWAFHSTYSRNVWVAKHYSLTINLEPKRQDIAIYARLNENDLLLRYMLRDEGIMHGDIVLYGGGKLSKKSFCVNCSKPILDQSRTRPRKRCEICRKMHIKKINKIHAERISKLKHEENELRKIKKLNATGTIMWSTFKI